MKFMQQTQRTTTQLLMLRNIAITIQLSACYVYGVWRVTLKSVWILWMVKINRISVLFSCQRNGYLLLFAAFFFGFSNQSTKNLFIYFAFLPMHCRTQTHSDTLINDIRKLIISETWKIPLSTQNHWNNILFGRPSFINETFILFRNGIVKRCSLEIVSDLMLQIMP